MTITATEYLEIKEIIEKLIAHEAFLKNFKRNIKTTSIQTNKLKKSIDNIIETHAQLNNIEKTIIQAKNLYNQKEK